MTDYLIRFTQTHESFRRPEIEALSTLADLPCEIVSYDEGSPFCILRFPTLVSQHGLETHDPALDLSVKTFESRSILSRCIYEVLGQGRDYDELHEDVMRTSQQYCGSFRHKSFKFSVDCYGSTRDAARQMQIIESFRYLGLMGKIKMKDPEVEFAVLEEWLPLSVTCDPRLNGAGPEPAEDKVAGTSLRRVFLARKIGDSSRWLREKHDLKKRPYISTTSMDAELALLTANMALASPGKIFLDPFVGTGGFMVAAAELGALVLGSDIDGRSYRGKGLGLDTGVGANLQKYGLTHLFGDCFTSDLTNTPFRTSTTHQSTSWAPYRNARSIGNELVFSAWTEKDSSTSFHSLLTCFLCNREPHCCACTEKSWGKINCTRLEEGSAHGPVDSCTFGWKKRRWWESKPEYDLGNSFHAALARLPSTDPL